MAKSLIINQLGSKKFTIFVPAGDTVASDFAQQFLDGESRIYQFVGEEGNETETVVKDVFVRIKDNTKDEVEFLRFYAKSTVDDKQILQTLKGKTFNGVKADVVTILGMERKVINQPQDNNNQGG